MKPHRLIAFISPLLICGGAMAAVVPSNVRVFNSVSDLKVQATANSPQISTSGYHYPADGGGQLFSIDTSTVPCTPNDIDCIASTDGTVFKSQNYSGDFRQAGAYCDVVTEPFGGTISSGSHEFIPTSIPFVASDVGKFFVMDYGNALPVFRTTIQSVVGGHAMLTTAAPYDYPGTVAATDANMDFVSGGAVAGAGYAPGQFVTAIPGTFTIAARMQIKYTQFVAPGNGSLGTNYEPQDILFGAATFVGTGKQSVAPAIQILAVDGSGVPTSWAIIENGVYNKNNASTLAWTGGHGTGFNPGILSSDMSFGIEDLTVKTKGSYTAPLPPNPVAVSGSGSGALVDLVFSIPRIYYGHDDTVRMQAQFDYSATFPTTQGGNVRAMTIPFGSICAYQNLLSSFPVTISGFGPKSSVLARLPGSPGLSINGSPPASIVIATKYPGIDDYAQAGLGQPLQTLNDFTIQSMSTSRLANVEGSVNPDIMNAVELTNPTTAKGKTLPVYMNNVSIIHFPNTLVHTTNWGGTLRGNQDTLLDTNFPRVTFTGTSHATTTIDGISSDDIAAISAAQNALGVGNLSAIGPGIIHGTTIASIGASSITLSTATLGSGVTDIFGGYGGGNCFEAVGSANPWNIVDLTTGKCNIGINLYSDSQFEFHHWTSFSTNMSLAASGQLSQTNAQINFYGAQLTESQFENLWVDVFNESVTFWGGRFSKSNLSQMDSGEGDADIGVGPNAGNGVASKPYPAVDIEGAKFDTDTVDNNVFATTDALGNYCACNIIVGSQGIAAKANGTGSLTANVPWIVSGPKAIQQMVFRQGALFPPQTCMTPVSTGWAICTDSVSNKLEAIFSDGTIFPLTTVIGSGAPAVMSNGASATVGTGSTMFSWEATLTGTPNSGLSITLPATTNKWECTVNDNGSASANPIFQLGSATTNVTMTSAATMHAGDVVHGICQPH